MTITRPSDQTLLDANDSFFGLFGFTREEAIGRKVVDDLNVYVDPGRRRAEIVRLFDEHGKVPSHEVRMRTKGGTALTVLFSSEMITYPGEGNVACTTIIDITERKAAEEALRASEEKLRRVYESGLLGVIYWNMNGSITDGNDKFLEMTGYARQELEAGEIDWASMTPEEYRDLDERSMDELKTTGMNRTPFEKEYIRKDGTRMPVLVAGAMLDESRFDGVAFVLDISERKEREARIARLTHLYATLSGVNEVIVRARDEERLYENVCRIIAAEGRFPLVWIGEVRGRELIPVTSCGPAADYLKDIRIEVDGELGQGPGGTCIREDRPAVNYDFDTNGATLPWREEALRYGFRSSACFPIHRHGKAAGALTLYSPEPGDFDAEQVDLLQALAADISYALDTMEHEKLRARAEADLQRSLKRFDSSPTARKSCSRAPIRKDWSTPSAKR